MSQTKTTTKGLRCDVCEKKDGMHGFTLLTCKTCNVSVHTSCYGLSPTTKNEEWECYACRPLEPNEKGIKPLSKRPNQCKLCPIKNGIHAMHPLYDIHGKEGKQIGWVHTLCALGIGANAITRGAVYGCDESGNYEGDDLEEPEPQFRDDSSISSNEDTMGPISAKSKKQPPSNNESEVSETHHFVICPTNDDSPWAPVVRDSRTLKCIICSLRDNRTGILRIPLQCEAGGEEEAPELKSRRKRTRTQTCYLAMHVGCARWKNDKPFQRVFFFPGMNQFVNGVENVIEPKCCVYCNTHGKDIYDHNPKNLVKPGTNVSTATTTVTQGKKSGSAVTAKANNNVTAPQGKKQPAQSNVQDSSSKSKPSNLESPDSKRNKRSSPPLSPPHRSITSPQISHSKPSSPSPQTELFQQVLDYVLQKLKESTKGKEVDATRKAKEYWKHKSKLPSNDFKEMWNRIKETVSKKVRIDKDRSNSITSIDSELQWELRRSSTASIDSTVLKELRRSSCTNIDSAVQRELRRSTSMTSIDSATRISRSDSITDSIDEITIDHSKSEELKVAENPWASLWMPNYQRDSEIFRLLLE